MAPTLSKARLARAVKAAAQKTPTETVDGKTPPVESILLPTLNKEDDGVSPPGLPRGGDNSGDSASAKATTVSNSGVAGGKSDNSSGKTSQGTPTSASNKAKYEAFKKKLKMHSPPKSARKQRKHKLKKQNPPPGDGKTNVIYTCGTIDESKIALAMHKKTPGEPAFTKPVDDKLRRDPAARDAFGIDGIYPRCDPDDGNQPLAIPYTNQKKEDKVKYFSIYHAKSDGTTKPRREHWGRDCLTKQFNRHASASNSMNKWGEEKFAYGGELEDDNHVHYLADFLTNDVVAQIMKDFFAIGEHPLTCAQLAETPEAIELYFGPSKMEEGKMALLKKANSFNLPDDNSDSELKPYESDYSSDN